jgi:hypothetical protein
MFKIKDVELLQEKIVRTITALEEAHLYRYLKLDRNNMRWDLADINNLMLLEDEEAATLKAELDGMSRFTRLSLEVEEKITTYHALSDYGIETGFSITSEEAEAIHELILWLNCADDEFSNDHIVEINNKLDQKLDN